MAITRLIARPLLASAFVVGGYHALRNPEPLKEKARRVVSLADSLGFPVAADAGTLVRVNGAAQIAAAAAFATGRAPRLSAAVLAGSLLPTTYAGHPFWEEKDPVRRREQLNAFAKNTSLLGGLVLAAFDTAGKPGVAWRVQHGARAAKREARHLAHDAKLEARLAASKLH